MSAPAQPSMNNISAVKAQTGLKETGTRYALMCLCNYECGCGAHFCPERLSVKGGERRAMAPLPIPWRCTSAERASAQAGGAVASRRVVRGQAASLPTGDIIGHTVQLTI